MFACVLGKVGVGSKSEGEVKEGEEEKVNDEGKVKEDGKVKDGNSGGLGYLSSAFRCFQVLVLGICKQKKANFMKGQMQISKISTANLNCQLISIISELFLMLKLNLCLF